MSTERFEQLRQYLSHVPSDHAWGKLCQLLLSWPDGDERLLALAYCEEHLAPWPDQVKSVPLEAFRPEQLHERPGSLWPLFRWLEQGMVLKHMPHVFGHPSPFSADRLPPLIPPVFGALPLHQDAYINHEGQLFARPVPFGELYIGEAKQSGISPQELGYFLSLKEGQGAALFAQPLVHRKNTLGRAPTSHICLSEDTVSRHHSSISFEKGVYAIKDEKSSQGLFVNGAFHTTQTWVRLRHGDVVKVGRNELLFVQGATVIDSIREAFWGKT